MAVEELSVAGLTGVDMRLRVAGPGTRSYAFVIDWHIRVLIALAWLLAGLLLRDELSSGAGAAIASRAFVFAVLAPAAIIYFLYHPVLEVLMRGSTPGLRKAGARIVTREGATPGTGALLMRNVFRLIDSLPALYVVGLACCIVTTRRVRLGDLAAGTLLVLDEAPAVASLKWLGVLLARSHLRADALALVRDLLERWPELAVERRAALARSVLSRLDARSRSSDLAGLGEDELRLRLEALLDGGSR